MYPDGDPENSQNLMGSMLDLDPSSDCFHEVFGNENDTSLMNAGHRVSGI